VRLEEVRRHTRGAVVYGLDLTLDGRKALLGGKRDLEIWDWSTDESKLAALRGEWVAMSPDGHTIAQSGPLVKIALGDLNTGKPIRDIFVGVMCSHVRFSPDGNRIVAGTIDKQAFVYDVTSGKRICKFEKHQAPLTRVGFLPGGKEAVSSGQDEYVRVWNAETAEERLALKHPEVAWGLAISPDGRLIATGTGGHTFDSPILHKMIEAKENVIRLWDSATGELVRELHGHNDVIYSLIFSPDGRSVISGSWDATLRVWDVASGSELAAVKGQGTIYALAITPDGSHIIAGGGENRSAGQPIRRYRDEQVRVYRLIEE
jgi:WD40 repeat protein